MNSNHESKGLQYILGDDLKSALSNLAKSKDQIREISISLIAPNPFRPRKIFDQEKLFRLGESLEKDGQRVPLIVRPKGQDAYEIVDGERRFRALKALGKTTVKAIIYNFSDQDMIELVLNEVFDKDEMSAIEEALVFANILKSQNLTHDQLALKIGKSRSYVSNAVRLLGFSPNVQEKIISHQLKMGQVRPLLGLKDKDVQKIIDLILENNLNVRDIEEISRNAKKGLGIKLTPSVHEQKISKKYNCQTKIRGFKIELYFETQEELMQFVLKTIEIK